MTKAGRLLGIFIFLIFFTGIGYSETTTFSVTTGEATSITSSSADLQGVISPAGSGQFAGWFEWGTTTSLGSKTDAQIFPTGSAAIQFDQTLKNLQPHTTYYYRAVGYYSGGTVSGTVRSFTTSDGPSTAPSLTVATEAATAVTSAGATLNATVNPGGVATTVWFNWGATTSLGTRTETQTITATTSVAVQQSLKSLQAHTTYYFRVEAYRSSDAASAVGDVKSFTTGDAPVSSITGVTQDATDVAATSGILNGEVGGGSGTLGAWFEWGTTTSLGTKTDVQVFTEGKGVLSRQLNNLQSHTTYYFRIVVYPAIAGVPNVLGEVKTFTTTGVPSTPPQTITDVEQGDVRSGYVIITPDPNTAAPTPTVTFGTINQGNIQSQAGMVPTPMMTDATLFVEVIPSISRSIGVALANPGGSVNAVTLTLHDEDGSVVGSPVVVSVPAHQQVSRFLNELFGSATIGTGFRGSVRMQSASAFAAIGLHFSGPLFSTLPVSITTAAAGVPVRVLTAGATPNIPQAGTVGGATSLIIPQFAMSGGWATQIALVDNTTSPMTGRLDVFDILGNPMGVKLNGETRSTFTYSIPAQGTLILAPRDTNGQSPF